MREQNTFICIACGHTKQNIDKKGFFIDLGLPYCENCCNDIHGSTGTYDKPPTSGEKNEPEWQVGLAKLNSEQLFYMLEYGWEPFAATQDWIYLKKKLD